jgi:cyclase
MFRPRIIPVLLLKGNVLVKTEKFKDPVYIGDPMNAVRIFNDLRADELVFLDIEASRQNRCISAEFVKACGEEANMPFAVGGGITSIEQIRHLLQAGAEKVIIGRAAFTHPEFVKQACDEFGTSTIAVCMDVKKKWLGGQQVFTLNASDSTGMDPVSYAQKMEQLGIGEIIVQSVDRDGTRTGYDVELLKQVSEAIRIPVIALGGASSLYDMQLLRQRAGVNGLAAGSMFVFHGKNKGVLIHYPDAKEKAGIR